MWTILSTLFVSIACAILYRMGGSGNYPRWTRVIMVPLATTLLAFLLGVHSWWILLSIPLTIGAISTYYDVLYKNFDNHWLHGLGIGLAAFPIAIVTGHWWLFAVRCILLAVLEGGWSAICKNGVVEENGRGFFIPATLWMIC